MIGVLVNIITSEINKNGIGTKYVINSLPNSIIRSLEKNYIPEIGLPWLILDNNSEKIFSPTNPLNTVTRYVEDDITSFRTFYTGKTGFLLFVSPGVNYQGSIDSTTNVINDLFVKVKEELLNRSKLDEELKDILKSCLELYLDQKFDPTEDIDEIRWRVVDILDNCINLYNNDLNGYLSEFGIFIGTTGENLDLTKDLILKLADSVYKDGIINTFDKLRSRAIDESLPIILQALDSLEENIGAKVSDAVAFSNTPFLALSNSQKDWWVILNISIWELLLGFEPKKEANFEISLGGDNYLEFDTKQILVLGGDIKLTINPSQNVEWKLNRQIIEPSASNILVASELLNENYVSQTFYASNGLKKKSKKLVHLEYSLLPVVLDCDTANRISSFIKDKSTKKFNCDIDFNSLGIHVLSFFYNSDWSLDPLIVCEDNSSDHENETIPFVFRRVNNPLGYKLGNAQVEIFADETCTYHFGITDPKGEKFEIIIGASSKDGESIDVKSYYDRLVAENINKGDITSKPKVVIPGGIFNLEKFIVKNKNISFNPIVIGPDFNETVNHADEFFNKDNYTILSNLYTFDKSFDERPLPFQEDIRFDKLISVRAKIIDSIFNADTDTNAYSYIETHNLTRLIEEPNNNLASHLDDYLAEFESLLKDPTTSDKLLWFDTFLLYWKSHGTDILKNRPSVIILSPLHPICLGWQVYAQQILQHAIDGNMHSPIAGLLSASQIPSLWALKLRSSNILTFVSTRSNLDYWRFFWNGSTITTELESEEIRAYLKSLFIEIDNSNISLTSDQVVSTLNQLKYLLPTANNYKIGVVGNDAFEGFNKGIEKWINNQFIKKDKESGIIDQIWNRIIPTTIDVFDYRDSISLPQNDILNNIVNEKNISLNWFNQDGQNSDSNTFNLGIITKLETNNSQLEDNADVVNSFLVANGTLRLDFNLNHGNAIIESKKVSSILDNAKNIFENLIIGLEKIISSLTGKNAYKYNPGLTTLAKFIRKADYTVISSSGLDLSYVLNYAGGQFKLWDYELPKYGKTLNSQDGYYMVSGHNKMHVNVIQDSIKRLTGRLPDATKGQELLDWMNRLGILSLKNLASGGVNSISEIGVLVTHLLIQPDGIELGDYHGLYPTITEESINFLIPVDPFFERIRMLKKFTKFENNKRPDLLLVQFDRSKEGNIYMSSIEVKTRNGSLNEIELKNAIDQADSFIEFLKKLESYSQSNIELWKIVFPTLISEMIRFSIGIKISNGLLTSNEVSFVRNSLELLYKGKGSTFYCKSWVFTVSEKLQSNSNSILNGSNIIEVNKDDILLLFEKGSDLFISKAKPGFLKNVHTCFSGHGVFLSKPAMGKSPDNGVIKTDDNGDLIKENTSKNIEPNLNYKSELKDRNRNIGKWESQYKEILSLLYEHGVKLNEITDEYFVEGPAFVTYMIEPSKGIKVSSIEKLHDELKLGLKLREDQRIRFKVDEGLIKIEVPKFEVDRYFIDAKLLWSNWPTSINNLEVPIGENQEGEIVTINFSSDNAPHLLIGGSTGSGKSEALNTILHGMCNFKTPDELKFILIDPKGTELVDFENSPYLNSEIGYLPEDATKALEIAVLEMENRYELMKANRVNKISKYNELENIQKLPWWIIVLDEYGDLTSNPEDKKEIEYNLKRLAQKARAAGIHIIVTTQKPSSEVISTNIRSNLGAQLALKVRGSAESKVILDKVGAEALNGKGDALFFNGNKLIRLQVAKYNK